MNVKKIIKDFPILRKKLGGKRLAYLDNAATTQKPLQVLEKEMEFYKNYNANIHRGLNALSLKATEAYEDAHSKTAKFISAKGIEEIIFTKNATESINLLAYSLGEKLSEGDEVVLTKMEHHANIVPWQQLAKRKKVKVKYANITSDGKLDMESLESLISERTKIVSVTMASNILGTINPVEKISKMAKGAGAYFIVDACQAAPHLKIDVKKINADFLAFSAHKMLGPTGVGVLYGKEEALNGLEPFLTGGDMISSVTLDGAEWNSLPWKFEAGTPNIAGGIAFGEALDYISKIGFGNIEGHKQKLLKHGLKRLSGIEGVQVYGPKTGPRTGIISFNIKGVHPHDVSEIMGQSGVIIRAGNHCAQPLMHEMEVEGVARASFYIYNTKEDIDLLADCAEQAKKVFRV